MSIIANALGGRVVQPGMLGPEMAEVTDLFNHFPLSKLWSPGSPPLVDYVLGSRPKGGIYVVGYTDDAYQRRMLDWFPPEIGPGPYYVLTRPYHLIHLETMRMVIEVAQTGRSLVAPRFGLCTEVICHAKRPLVAGDVQAGLHAGLKVGLSKWATVDRLSANTAVEGTLIAQMHTDVQHHSRISLVQTIR